MPGYRYLPQFKRIFLSFVNSSDGDSIFAEKNIDISDEDAKYSIKAAMDLPLQTINSLVDMTYLNMRGTHYQTLSSSKCKKTIMSSRTLVFLREGTADVHSSIHAFITFRFMTEYEENRLYIYEFQCSPRYTRRGIGTHMLDTLIRFLEASKLEVHAIALTCSQTNPRALLFYTKYGFYDTEESADPERYSILRYAIAKAPVAEDDKKSSSCSDSL